MWERKIQERFVYDALNFYPTLHFFLRAINYDFRFRSEEEYYLGHIDLRSPGPNLKEESKPYEP